MPNIIMQKNVKIYSCYHKKSLKQKSDVVIPLHVGHALAKYDLGFIGDDTGDNISLKNPYFCELTGMYWVWKNVQADIVGLMHYRRVFNFRNNNSKCHSLNFYAPKRKVITNTLKDYDIIVPEKTYWIYERPKIEFSLYEQYTQCHVKSDLDLVVDIIGQKYPEMKEATQQILNSKYIYIANMMITRKEVFDDYAKWLFDILFEVEKRIQPEVLKRDSYQQRVYGFLAERMTGIYIAAHPELKIKEVPIVFYEENLSDYLKYRIDIYKRKIKAIKRGILIKLGLGKEKWKINTIQYGENGIK